jgi:hypothetical protein
MSLGDYIRDSFPWHRRAADVVDQLGPIFGGTSTSSGNAYTITTTPVITRLTNGQRFHWIPDATNTGSATIAVSRVAAKSITRPSGSGDLLPGELAAGYSYVIEYVTSSDKFKLIQKSRPILTDISVSGINGKTVAATQIGTTFAGGTRFYPTLAIVEIEAVTALTVLPTVSIGTNSATYNNICAAAPLTGIAAVGDTTRLAFTNPIAALNGVDVYLNVSVGATATTLTLKVILFGFHK